MAGKNHNSSRTILAFLCVYIFWGSTYLAIKVAGEHLPAPVVSAARSLISAGLIAIITLLRRKDLRVPRGEGWKLALVGVAIMSGNNMLLTWGEKLVPTGFASLLIATMPIMVALMEAVLPGGEILNFAGWAGTLLGTAGIGVLVWPSIHSASASEYAHPLLGVVLVLGAAFAFAVGSILSRRFRFQADSFIATGWQIGAAGIFNTSVVVGGGVLHRAVWTWSGFGAIVYLSVFGSLVGLVAFTYLLKNVAVSKVATYAFVNPAIAVLLGVVFLHERLVPAELAGMAIIIAAVAIVVLSRVDRTKREIVGNAGNAME